MLGHEMCSGRITVVALRGWWVPLGFRRSHSRAGKATALGYGIRNKTWELTGPPDSQVAACDSEPRRLQPNPQKAARKAKQPYRESDTNSRPPARAPPSFAWSVLLQDVVLCQVQASYWPLKQKSPSEEGLLLLVFQAVADVAEGCMSSWHWAPNQANSSFNPS